DRRILMINAKNGGTNLVYLTRNATYASAATSGNVAILGSNDRVVRAIDVHAGNLPLEKSVLKWWAQFYVWGMAPFPPAQSGTVWIYVVGKQIQVAPAVSGQHVVVAGLDGTVLGLRMIDGEPQWTSRLEEKSAKPTAPIIVNDRVYVGTDSGTLHALDIADGEPEWTFLASGSIQGSPAFADGLLYFVTTSGTVYALE
ncbi:MAG: PQQ-binding-like beta-propeller repeat protein, partial [Chloroflexi bacterium]|nr:PQQ-binding-like beta-propeller repeat protein [Chloroflexota bacterium]